MSFTTTKTAELLMEIDNEVWDELGFTSRPTGHDRYVYFQTIIPRIKKYKRVGSRVRADLTWWNFHSLVQALDIVQGNVTLDELMTKEKLMYGEW